MLGKSHAKIALGLTLFTADPNIILGAVVGSLWPDIDKKNTILGRYNILLGFNKFKKLLKHRGFTHSIYGTMWFIMLLRLFMDEVSIMSILFGIITHLVADSYSPMGIQLFWLPYQSDNERKKNTIVLGHLETGGMLEWMISTSILFLGLLIFIRRKMYV